MNRRVFIALTIPKNLAKRIESLITPLKGGLREDVRFIVPENWHVTLAFLGLQSDEALGKIIAGIKTSCQGITLPEIAFTRLVISPQQGVPRMVWLEGDTASAKKLEVIRKNIDSELLNQGINYKLSAKKFTTHITVARFQKKPIKSLETVTFPAVRERELGFQPERITLMESELTKNGSVYTELASFS
ncbi:MAG: RNA 2',3'-cyclic phosphodiesterase [Candidatus Harrisonbacteria bacterium CG10_big_fil_rev_8_21_14_0_10_42_17]|uniref:RNA 2',3'-cyclic phosphodiesterase n=1 Tax=Candidatus Harrisonbacteria bacterium CG10_big_fil_rev_8_21_14_0_10_42_17 TaxID=1974584 RepID=A0A2M6WH29_9BACT|nr:MAG: RNA 2',3'-cyclic phosphodiesterase [Candidatus Harrisonbacteria bacterium CG10_big_fil_rev_8_21_14_0_10_42_17]